MKFGACARAKFAFGIAAWATCTCKFCVRNRSSSAVDLQILDAAPLQAMAAWACANAAARDAQRAHEAAAPLEADAADPSDAEEW